MAKFDVEIKNAEGTCTDERFSVIVKNGDLQAEKVVNHVGEVIKITGYAEAHISTDTKDFDMIYYATDNGYLSSGSKVFFDSVKKYISEFDTFKINSIKTSKGTTFKVTPIL